MNLRTLRCNVRAARFVVWLWEDEEDERGRATLKRTFRRREGEQAGAIWGAQMGLSPVLVSMRDMAFRRSHYLGAEKLRTAGSNEMGQDGALGAGTCRRPAYTDSACARVMMMDGKRMEGA